jgi:hypothetical protein
MNQTSTIEMTSQKLYFQSVVNKDIINDSFIPLLSKLAWDSYNNALLRVKALPKEPLDLRFAYIPYWQTKDEIHNDYYRIRTVIKILRNRNRGRRSNQFKKIQWDSLAKYKSRFINQLENEIRESGILTELG